MSSQPQASPPRNEQRRARVQAMSLTAWDLARNQFHEHADPRARIMTLRTHERLRTLAEAELGVAKHKRTFLKVGQEGQPGVLLVHGTDQTPAHMVPLARVMHEAGLTVHGLLLADYGHGVTGGPEARWRATLQQVRHGHRLLADSCRDVYVLGSGFGAALALHLASRERVAGLVLIAPAIVPRVDLKIRLLRSLGLLRVPQVRRRMGLRVDVLEGMQAAQDLIPRVDVPMFGVMCDDDDRVSPEALRILQKRARHPRCRFQIFPEGGHDVLAAHGSASLDQDIIDFIRARD
ncbi:alpha/beta fold hydrolase [bacterium]|nr:alpha/beta fold hydrolase [bacterium]